MKQLIATTALFLILPGLALGQGADHRSFGLGYAFVGGCTHGMGQTAGFGMGYVSNGVGMGIEFAAAGLGSSANSNRNTIGMGSADLSYHYFPKKLRGYVSPFVAGGYTVFFGQDKDTPGGNHTSGVNIGGGLDIFALEDKYAGLRFDFRYNGHGGRILWASFPNTAQLSFVTFRVGLVFR
jgi:hypothetical protein